MFRSFRSLALASVLAFTALGPSVAADPIPADQKAAFEALIREYLVSHPEVIQEALAALEKKKRDEEAAAANAAIAGMRDTLYSSTRQAVLGDPKAPITLVEFFDYNCGYCKRALADTLAMLDEDKDVKIVLKELPILGPGSVEAARVAIAANLVAPDKYLGFHKALLGGKGQADEARALAAVEEAGIDRKAVEAKLKDAEVEATIEEVYAMANRLGLSGTPTYVIGDEVVFGAVGVDELRTKVDAMRDCGKATC